MSFTRQVQYLHEQIAPDLPIESFVDALRPEALGLTDRTQFYAPVRFTVQVCDPVAAAASVNGGSGAIRVDVPVHANPNWAKELKERFSGMVGGANPSGVGIEFRTVNGRNIETLPIEALPNVGKLNVYRVSSGGKAPALPPQKLRLSTMPVIPVEYSINKEANVQTWFREAIGEDCATPLAEKIANHLSALTSVDQIDTAIRGDGPIVKMIERHLEGSSPTHSWTEFVRVHNINSPATLSAAEASDSLTTISSNMLAHMRRIIEASAQPIKTHLAGVESKRLQTLSATKSDHFAPVLGAAVTTGGSASLATGAYDMFYKIAQDALSSPIVEHAVIGTIYTKPIGKGCRWTKDPPPAEKKAKAATAVAPPPQTLEVQDAREAEDEARREEEEARRAADEAARAQAAAKTAEQIRTAKAAKDRADQKARAATENAERAERERLEAEQRALAEEEQKRAAGSAKQATAATPVVQVAPVTTGIVDANDFITRLSRAATSEDNRDTFMATQEVTAFFAGAKPKDVAIIITRYNVNKQGENPVIDITLRPKQQVNALTGWLRNADINVLANPAPVQARIEAHHPWNAQIHHTLQPLSVNGAYPTYYNVLHTKQDMTKDAPYVGNVAETYRAYHLFAGLPISPPGLVIDPTKKRTAEMPPLVPIAGRHHHHHHAHGDDETEGKEWKPKKAAPAPVKSELPPLVPIAGRHHHSHGNHRGHHRRNSSGSSGSDEEDKDDYMRRMRAPLVGSRLPPLVPINCGSCGGGGCGSGSDEEDEDEKKPAAASINSKAPPVIPIGSKASIPPRPPLKRLTDAQLKVRARMVPIEDDSSSSSMVNEEMAESFGLPVCSDVFDD
jgi:hypothetical protein